MGFYGNEHIIINSIISCDPVTNQKWKTGEKCPKRGYFVNYFS